MKYIEVDDGRRDISFSFGEIKYFTIHQEMFDRLGMTDEEVKAFGYAIAIEIQAKIEAIKILNQSERTNPCKS